MTRKVKNVAELKSLALDRGLQVTLPDGGVFNADRKAIPARKKPPIKKVEAPEPVAKAERSSGIVDGLRALVLSITELVSRQDSKIEIIRADLERAANQTLLAGNPPDHWVYDIQRNRDGFISKIVAKPVFSPKRLN